MLAIEFYLFSHKLIDIIKKINGSEIQASVNIVHPKIFEKSMVG